MYPSKQRNHCTSRLLFSSKSDNETRCCSGPFYPIPHTEPCTLRLRRVFPVPSPPWWPLEHHTCHHCASCHFAQDFPEISNSPRKCRPAAECGVSFLRRSFYFALIVAVSPIAPEP